MTEQSQVVEISEREHSVLRTLVDLYITGGQPIGSRTLSRVSGIDISAASIRNVMCDLEELGLLRSPHTSAGRIPTTKAYRMFVDTMMNVRPLGPGTVRELKQALDPKLSEQQLVKVASNYLSGITQMAGMVTIPRRAEQSIQQVEFVPLSDKRVLAILITRSSEIQNRIIQVDRDYTKQELEYVSNYINEELADRPLEEMRDILHEQLVRAKEDMNEQMQKLIEFADLVFDNGSTSDKSSDDEDIVVAGESNLIGHSDLSDADKLRSLFEAFEKKRDIYHLLERCGHADGVQVFIGKESGFEALDDYSLISATYHADHQPVGVLGVIGPKRMAYERVVSAVDVTSKLLSAALKSS